MSTGACRPGLASDSPPAWRFSTGGSSAASHRAARSRRRGSLIERPDADRAPPRGDLALPEHPPGVLRGAPPPRRLARRPAARGRDVGLLPRALHDQGRAPASAATAVAAACFRARLAGEPSPARGTDERTAACRSRRRWLSCGSSAAARAAGVEPVTAHSGRVGLASELTSRGASTTDVMLAGNWKTSRMVAHYSAGATAERGAVARYL